MPANTASPCAKKWGNATVEDVMEQARKLVERIVREDQCFGSVEIVIRPGSVDVKQSTVNRYGQPLTG